MKTYPKGFSIVLDVTTRKDLNSPAYPTAITLVFDDAPIEVIAEEAAKKRVIDIQRGFRAALSKEGIKPPKEMRVEMKDALPRRIGGISKEAAVATVETMERDEKVELVYRLAKQLGIPVEDLKK